MKDGEGKWTVSSPDPGWMPKKQKAFVVPYIAIDPKANGHLPIQETQETQIRSLGQEDLLKEGMATHSSILAWIIPWTEEPGGLPSMGSHRVGHD